MKIELGVKSTASYRHVSLAKHDDANTQQPIYVCRITY